MNKCRDWLLNSIVSAAHSGPVAAEIFMAITALRWAVFIAIPSDILLNTRENTISSMLSIAPMWFWVTAFVSLAFVQIWSIAEHHKTCRQCVALVGLSWWTIITSIDAMSGFSAATITISLFVVMQAIIYMTLTIAYEEASL